MTDFNQFFGDFFSVSNCPDGGIDLTITEVGRQDVGRGEDKEAKLVVAFREDPKRVVLNRARASQLAALAGSNDIEAWVGKKVHLTVDPHVKFGAKAVGGLAFVGA